MPRDYNINISVSGGDRRGAFGGGNLSKTKTTLNSKRNIDTDGETNSNLSKVFSVGLAFNKAQQANELLGAYTGNRLRQRQFDVGMTFVKYGIGLAVNPVAGAIYATSDLAYRGLMYGIKIDKANRQSEVYRNISGNNSYSGRRYRGGFI